jgi:hypothetical protein
MHTAGASFVGLSDCVLAVASIMPLHGACLDELLCPLGEVLGMHTAGCQS